MQTSKQSQSWLSCLSPEQLEAIRNPRARKKETARGLLAQFLGIPADAANTKAACELNLYVSTLQFAQELRLPDDRKSVLVGIVKEVHTASVKDSLTIERSFKLFKKLLLQHSMHRPPYSIGLYTLPQVKIIVDWMLDTYYRHYKLYQYVFTSRVTMSVSTTNPGAWIEQPPELQGLSDAITEAEQLQILEEEERQRLALAKQQQEEQARLDEEARIVRLKEEYLAAMPEEVKKEAEGAVEKERALLRAVMEDQFQTQQTTLLARISELSAQLASITAASPAAAP